VLNLDPQQIDDAKAKARELKEKIEPYKAEIAAGIPLAILGLKVGCFLGRRLSRSDYLKLTTKDVQTMKKFGVSAIYHTKRGTFRLIHIGS
jgi:hypothetical protein